MQEGKETANEKDREGGKNITKKGIHDGVLQKTNKNNGITVE